MVMRKVKNNTGAKTDEAIKIKMRKSISWLLRRFAGTQFFPDKRCHFIAEEFN